MIEWSDRRTVCRRPELPLVPKHSLDQCHRLSDLAHPLQFTLRTLRSVWATCPPGVGSLPNRHRCRPRESGSPVGHPKRSSLSFLLTLLPPPTPVSPHERRLHRACCEQSGPLCLRGWDGL